SGLDVRSNHNFISLGGFPTPILHPWGFGSVADGAALTHKRAWFGADRKPLSQEIARQPPPPLAETRGAEWAETSGSCDVPFRRPPHERGQPPSRVDGRRPIDLAQRRAVGDEGTYEQAIGLGMAESLQRRLENLARDREQSAPTPE